MSKEGQETWSGQVGSISPRTDVNSAWAAQQPWFYQDKNNQQEMDWADYNAKAAKGEVTIPPARDLKLESLVEVLDGKRYVHSHCYRQDEILMLLRVADEFGFKIRTLQHGLEAYKVAKEIAAKVDLQWGTARTYAAAILAADAISDAMDATRECDEEAQRWNG